MGKIIGVCNQKGGTGKTTTAINVSSYLGLYDKKVLLIDFDPQGNATSGVGFDSEDKNSAYDIIAGQVSVYEGIYETEWPQLYIMPSNISLTGGEVELVNIENREERLKSVIYQLKEDFDYIIIDAPPSLGLLTLNVLVASDSLLIPIQCEYYALEGLSKLVQTIDLVTDNLNLNLTIEAIILTMADFRTRLTLQVIEEVRNFFPDKTLNTIIPRNIKLAEAPSFGKPIYFYDKNCVGAKAYSNVTEDLLKKNIKEESVRARS